MDNDLKLKKQFFKGSIWLFGANIFARIFSFVTTLVLAKLLTPEDFGLVGYGFLVVNTIALFKMMGFNTALIYQKDKINESASSLFWFLIIWSLFLYGVVYFISPIISSFFREVRLISLVRVLGLSLIINSISSIPTSLLEREIDFKRRVIPDVVKLLIYSIVTILLALKGFKYWSFIYGTLLADLIQLILAFLLKPVKIKFEVHFSLLREMFKFGRNIVGLSFIHFGIRNIDDFFIGRMLGTKFLGFYQFSYRIANVPATNITNVFGKILFPTFSKIADSDEKLLNAFMKFFRFIVLITVPVTFFIILIIPDFISGFYGKWESAIIPIQIISYFGLVRSVGSGMGSVFYAKGKPEKLLPVALTQFIVLSLILFPLIHFYGIIGACIAINISMTISFIGSFWELNKLVKLSFWKVFSYLAFPISISLIIYFGVSILCNLFNLSTVQFFFLKFFTFPLLILVSYFIFIQDKKEILRELQSLSK